MRLSYHGTKNYVKMECAGTNKGVQFHPYGSIPAPYTDGRTIHLYEPNGAWTEEQWEDWEYLCQHEIGHEVEENSYPHWKQGWGDKCFPNTLLHFLSNLCSDHVQEHNRVGVYTGRDRILKKGRARHTDKVIGNLDEHSTTKEGAILRAAAVLDAKGRETWNEYLVGAPKVAVDALSDEERDLYNKLIDANLHMEDMKNEDDAYSMAKAILDAVGEDSKKHEEHNKKMQEAAAAGEEMPGEGEGEETEGEGGDENGKGKVAKGVTKGQLGKDAEKEAEGVLYHTHYEKPTPGAYKPPTDGQHIEYDPKSMTSSGFVPKDFKEIVLKNGDKGPERGDPHIVSQCVDRINRVHAGEMLAGQVKRLLISMKQLRWEHGHKRGHISGKNLWKARRPSYEDTVFKRRAQTLELNTAVTILTDNSGSMSGDKFAHAAKAGVMLNEAMTKVGVPVELLSFSETIKGPTHVVVKDFNERMLNDDILIERYAQCAQWMCQNSDGESIQWAYERLRKRRESRRVLIVLSDGSPAAYNGDYSTEYTYTQSVIKEIEDNTPIEIYGIGIMDDNVEALYKEHKVLNDSSELENMLLGLVKQKVLK